MTTKNIGIKQSLSHTIEFSKNTHPPTPPATQPANFSEHKLSFGVCHPLRGNSTSLADPIPGRKPGHPDPAGRTCSAHPEPRCTSLHTAEKHQGDRREPRTRFRKPLTWTFVPVRLPGAAPCRSDSKKVTRRLRTLQIGWSGAVSFASSQVVTYACAILVTQDTSIGFSPGTGMPGPVHRLPAGSPASILRVSSRRSGFPEASKGRSSAATTT